MTRDARELGHARAWSRAVLCTERPVHWIHVGEHSRDCVRGDGWEGRGLGGGAPVRFAEAVEPSDEGKDLFALQASAVLAACGKGWQFDPKLHAELDAWLLAHVSDHSFYQFLVVNDWL